MSLWNCVKVVNSIVKSLIDIIQVILLRKMQHVKLCFSYLQLLITVIKMELFIEILSQIIYFLKKISSLMNLKLLILDLAFNFKIKMRSLVLFVERMSSWRPRCGLGFMIKNVIFGLAGLFYISYFLVHFLSEEIRN